MTPSLELLRKNALERYRNRDRDDVDQLLFTPRIVQILALVACGWQNDEIGDVLGITGKSVKNHLTRIMERFDAVNRSHLLYIYIRSPQCDQIGMEAVYLAHAKRRKKS